MKTRAALVAGICALAALAAPALAQATIRVEGTAQGGLVITDLNNGFDDDIVLGLVSTATGLEWEVSKTFSCNAVIPVACLDADRYDAIGDCDEENGAVRCPRLGTRVTVNVLGGRDRMEIAPNTVPITDRIAFNGGEGSDVVHTGNGDDIINGGNGADFALFGGPGNDTISGGAGRDDLLGEGGDDTLNGGDDDDQIELGSGADTATGGGGNDLFDLATPTRDGRDDVNGGIGSDKATYTGVLFRSSTRLTAMRFIEANLETLAGQKDTDEGDVLRSIEIYSGGADEDILTGVLSSNPSTYMGEGDEDTIFGSSGPNTLIGGASGDSMDGNAGNDVLDGKAGEGSVAIKDFLVDCGDGTNDLAVIDLKDAAPKFCENVDRSPAGEGPHVKPLIPRRGTRVRAARVSFRLRCPRPLKRRCAGSLALKLGRAKTARTRYAVRPGRTGRVTVQLGSLAGRLDARTVAQLISEERGKFPRIGLKTTIRRVVLRG